MQCVASSHTLSYINVRCCSTVAFSCMLSTIWFQSRCQVMLVVSRERVRESVCETHTHHSFIFSFFQQARRLELQAKPTIALKRLRLRTSSVEKRPAPPPALDSQQSPRPRFNQSISQERKKERKKVRGREFIDSQTGILCGIPQSAMCVQRLDDSRNSAIHITYRVSLRSSSLREPRDPLLKVV